MMTKLYFIALIITLVDLVYLSRKNVKKVDIYLWSAMFLFPVTILGYWLKTTVHTQEAAMISFCFIYVDSTILLAISLFSILRSMKIKVSGWIKIGVYGLTVFHLVTIWLSKDNNLYYKSMELIDTGKGIATRMTSGPLKMTHYIYLGLMMFLICGSLIYGILRKGTFSRKSLYSYSAFTVVGILIYICEMVLDVSFSVLPFMYTAGSVYLTIKFDMIQSHDIHSLIGEKQSKNGLRGFAAFDKGKHLLGYNTQFANIFPDIKNIVIDDKISREYGALADYLNPLIDRCIEQGNYSDSLEYNDRCYEITVSSFSISEQSVFPGYFIEFADVTEKKQHIELIKEYNQWLGQDVKEKTSHILEIQNSVVLGMANLVENRDNNTGGHIKRTSDIIKILVKEAVKQQLYNIDEEGITDIIRAAPMHDLGKMYIGTEILCKPGKLTDEEYAIMKTHAPKSGEMVKIILEGVEESHFVKTAYNIARFHHERWDGRGYPEGLMGESIPAEARIMAVADVYDALVSKRCYKESMSYDVASRIMNENMGTQFDPAMRPVFNACRTSLEEYYSSL